MTAHSKGSFEIKCTWLPSARWYWLDIIGLKGARLTRKSVRRDATSSARSQPILPSLLELQAFLTSSVARMECGSPGVAKDGRCECAGVGSSKEIDWPPTPWAESDNVVVWPDLISRNKSPNASFPFVTVVVTIVFSRSAFDARAGAEVGRAPTSE